MEPEWNDPDKLVEEAYLDEYGRSSFGPGIVADDFRAVAILVLCAAIGAALVEWSHPRGAIAALITIGAGIVTAALLAFCAYALDLLVSVRDNTNVLANFHSGRRGRQRRVVTK